MKVKLKTNLEYRTMILHKGETYNARESEISGYEIEVNAQWYWVNIDDVEVVNGN